MNIYTHKRLLYDADTGKFQRRNGRPAGTPHKESGYVILKVGKKQHRAHRLAWFMVHGHFPQDQLDHINEIKDDNRLCNLRECSSAENNQNRAAKGYTYSKSCSKWQAQIMIKGVSTYLGIFDTEERASSAYKAAKFVTHPFNPIPREELL